MIRRCKFPQRFFDIALVIPALLILSPVLVFTSIILRLSGEGEIFFLQDRVGKNGNIFKLYKFATMYKNSPNIGSGTLTLANDSRILPIGKLLRKIKVNELPQLFNIIIGDMSFVGPRPQTEECFEFFSHNIRNTLVQVTPGLSGVGSIVFRNEDLILDAYENPAYGYRNRIMPYKGKLELWFVNHKTPAIYFLIILITFWVVIFPRSGIIWRLLKGLPKPPSRLRRLLNYSC